MFITKEWKQPNPPSTKKYLNKPYPITKMEYYIEESVKNDTELWQKQDIVHKKLFFKDLQNTVSSTMERGGNLGLLQLELYCLKVL